MAIRIRPASLGGSASVPNATTTTSGKVRLATIAEAQAGTSELIAVTPAGLQAELAGLTGGMEFKGAYDIGIGVPDLTTGSTKAGDYYVVTNVKLNPTDTNVTKELYGQEWAVGDHLVVTRDIASGETDYDDAITKVDNSESISVLTDLLDVAINAEANGQVLVYDGTGEEWINRELTVADVLNAVTQADHDALTARVTTNEGDISSIDGRLTTAEGEIGTLQTEQATTQSSAGLNSNGSYTPDPTATYISTATTLKQADSLLDDQVKVNRDSLSSLNSRLTTAEGELDDIQAELDATQSGAGLAAGGQYINSPSANYIASATSLRGADTLLDAQVKLNADGVASLQFEVNTTQSGAGLTSGGAYIVDGSSNYIASATNLADADTLLDEKLKETRDIVDNLGANSVATVNGVSPVSGDVTVGGADIDTAHTASNYTASAADLDSHLSGVDTELGNLQTQITSNDGDISSLDGRVTANEGNITALDGRLTTAEGEIDGLQTELDATQSGAGLETDGSYVANGATNYIGAVSTLKGADEALDAKLKETRDLVDNFSTNNVASVNGISPVSGDVTVGAADIDSAHTAVNYTAAAADLDSHLAGIDTEVGLAVNSVNTLTPTDGALTLGGADIETAHTASDYTASAADLDSHLAGIDTRLADKANTADLADIATSGTASDASVTATPTEYSAATADVEAHLAGIDSRLADKANSADLADIATSGAASDASVVATPTNYTSASADVEAHLAGIDTKLGTLETATVNNIAAVDGNITLGGADIETAHTAVSYTASAADLDSHLAGIDTELGLAVNSVNTLTPTDGALTLGGADIETAHTAVSYTASAADLDSHLAGIDTQFGSVTTSLAAHQSEINATQTGAGLEDDGSYVAPSVDGDLLSTATSLRNADEVLAANVFTNLQKHSAEFVLRSINTSQVGTDYADAMYVIPMGSSALTISLPDATDAEELLNAANGFAVSNRSANDVTIALGVQTANIDGVDYQVYFGGELESDPATEYDALITSITVPPRTTLYFAMDRHTVGGSLNRYVFYPRKIDSLAQMSDVDLTGLADGDALVYSATNGRFEVSPLGTTSVSSVNGVSPVGGDVALGGADIDTAHTAVGYTASAADLDSHLAGIDTSLQGKSLVSASIITGAGLEEDGSYLANGATNYLDTATSLKEADEALDTELALKANIASPALTGTPTAPTASLGTNTTQIATTAFVASGLALKANIASPALTGTPTAPTASQGTNTTQIATTAFVASELSALSTTAQGAEGVIQVSDGSAGFAAGQWSLNATSGAFLPDGNSTRDIGSASARAKDAYLNALKVGAGQLDVSIDGTSGRLVAGGGATALTADSTEIVLSSDLATVATSGDYADLSNAPTSFINSASFITDADALTLESGKHYIIGTATGSTKTMTLPSVTNNGEYIRVTNWGLGELVIQVDQADTNAHLLVGQNITLNGQVTVESKATVDLFGFNYSQGGTDYQPAWGCYFSSSIELNTRSFTTDGQLPVYDATKQELYAGDLGDLSLSFSATNYDETRGATVDGTKVIHHLGGIDDELGALDTALTTLDGEAVKTVNTLTPTDGAVVLGGADIETAHTAVNYTASAADLDSHLAGLDTEVGLAVNSVNTITPTDGALTLGGEHIDTAHTASDYTAAASDLDSHLAGIDTRLSEKVNAADGLNGLDDVDLTVAPTDGQILLFDGVSSTFKAGPPPAPVADETTLGLVELATDAEAQAATATDRAIVPSNLAALDLDTFADVAYPSAPTDNQVLQWVNTNSRWEPKTFSPPAPNVTSASPGSTYAITTHEGIEEIYLLTPSVNCTVSLPTASASGSGYKYNIKNLSANEITINDTIDGVSGLVLGFQNASATIVSDGTSWYVI